MFNVFIFEVRHFLVLLRSDRMYRQQPHQANHTNRQYQPRHPIYFQQPHHPHTQYNNSNSNFVPNHLNKWVGELQNDNSGLAYDRFLEYFDFLEARLLR